MSTSEIIIRMENLCYELSKNNHNCFTNEWSKGFRKGYIEAINTMKLMIEAQEIQQSITIVTASATPDNIKEVDDYEERKEVNTSQPRRYAVRA